MNQYSIIEKIKREKYPNLRRSQTLSLTGLKTPTIGDFPDHS